MTLKNLFKTLLSFSLLKQAKTALTPLIPENAVLAVDDPNGCPEGYSQVFEGRVLVGQGDASLATPSNDNTPDLFEFGEVGGTSIQSVETPNNEFIISSVDIRQYYAVTFYCEPNNFNDDKYLNGSLSVPTLKVDILCDTANNCYSVQTLLAANTSQPTTNNNANTINASLLNDFVTKDTFNNSVAVINAKIYDDTQEIQNLQSQVTTLNDTARENKNDISGNKDNIDINRKNITQLNQKLENIGRDPNLNITCVCDEEELGDLKSRLEALEAANANTSNGQYNTQDSSQEPSNVNPLGIGGVINMVLHAVELGAIAMLSAFFIKKHRGSKKADSIKLSQTVQSVSSQQMFAGIYNKDTKGLAHPQDSEGAAREAIELVQEAKDGGMVNTILNLNHNNNNNDVSKQRSQKQTPGQENYLNNQDAIDIADMMNKQEFNDEFGKMSKNITKKSASLVFDGNVANDLNNLWDKKEKMEEDENVPEPPLPPSKKVDSHENHDEGNELAL